MPVDELLRRISSRELTEWQIYEREEPFGERKQDWRTALIASTVANTVPRKSRKKFGVKDFLPKYGLEEDTEVSPDRILSKILDINRRMGGTEAIGQSLESHG